VAFAKFTAYIFPALGENSVLFTIGNLNISKAQVLAVLLIQFLTFVNTKGIQGGKIIQTTFTTAKLLSLFGLIIFGFLLAAKSEIWNANWKDA
ncbi:hypothetical protein ACE40V_23915, partial [Salmonella enterica]|uniref:hypothetical protein n=1 Tax=Salmonella enterica TaxID=28901 RepID=UPI003D2CFC34